MWLLAIHMNPFALGALDAAQEWNNFVIRNANMSIVLPFWSLSIVSWCPCRRGRRCSFNDISIEMATDPKLPRALKEKAQESTIWSIWKIQIISNSSFWTISMMMVKPYLNSKRSITIYLSMVSQPWVSTFLEGTMRAKLRKLDGYVQQAAADGL